MAERGSQRFNVARLNAVLAVALATGIIAGCAGAPQERMSRTYMEAGDYDRAVETAQQAVAKSPNNPAYLDALSDAQTAAADYHFEQAKQFLANRQPLAAKAEVDRTLSYMPAHPGANSLQVQVREALADRDELVAKPQAVPLVKAPSARVQVQPAANPRAGQPREAMPPSTPALILVEPTAANARSEPTVTVSTRPAPGGLRTRRAVGQPAPVNRARESGREEALPGRIATARLGAVDNGSRASAPARPDRQPSDRHLMTGIISRHNSHFKKTMAIMDGLTVKVVDTDRKPLDADLEIVAGKSKMSPDDIPVGGSVKIKGVSGREYKLTILWIDHDQDSVKFAVDGLGSRQK